ncbi:MAG: response regulator, partial [Actinomycetota bacterium]
MTSWIETTSDSRTDSGPSAERLELVARMSLALAEVGDESELFAVVAQRLDALFAIDRITVSLATDDGAHALYDLGDGSRPAEPCGLLDTSPLAMNLGVSAAEHSRRPPAGPPGIGAHPIVHTAPSHAALEPLTTDSGALVIVPLAVGDLTMGTLNVARRPCRDFDADEVSLLTLAAEFTAVALRSVRALRAAAAAERESVLAHRVSARRISEIDTLNRVLQHLTGLLDLRGTLEGVADELLQLPGIDRCEIALADDGHDEDGHDDAAQGDGREAVRLIRSRADNGRGVPDRIHAAAVRDRELVIHFDDGPIDDPEAEALRRAGLGAVAAAPILVGDQVLGSIALASAEQGRGISGEHVVIAQTVAAQLGAALDRLRLFDEQRTGREEAEASSRAKGEFLANMSHELRTPLNGVIAMTTLLADTELDDRQQSYADTIRTSGTALLAVINDILDLSKIEAGKFELEDAPFDVRTVAAEALDLVAATAGAKEIDLIHETAAEVPVTVRGDAGRLRQVLLNLLGNAVKFTDVGEVLLRIDTTTVAPSTDDPQADGPGSDEVPALRFSVHDTGGGIGRADLDRLFDAFTQFDPSAGRRLTGTGLGLAISRTITELMDGAIDVESTVGLGSTFTVTIPLPVVDGPRRRSELDLGGRHLLLLDHESTARALLDRQLCAWGARVTTAASVDDAVAVLEVAGAIDGIVADARACDATGRLAELPHRSRGRGGMILLHPFGRPASGRAIDGDARLLAKPIKTSTLATMLRQMFEQASSGDDAPGALGARIGERHPLRVLVVEDNPTNQTVAMAMLERLGYHPDLATNGHQALNAMLGADYDLVLMDVQMPGLDGLEATRRMRGIERVRQPRIVAMTANALKGDRERCLDAGMDDYLTKPIDGDTLAAELLATPKTPLPEPPPQLRTPRPRPGPPPMPPPNATPTVARPSTADAGPESAAPAAPMTTDTGLPSFLDLGRLAELPRSITTDDDCGGPPVDAAADPDADVATDSLEVNDIERSPHSLVDRCLTDDREHHEPANDDRVAVDGDSDDRTQPGDEGDEGEEPMVRVVGIESLVAGRAEPTVEQPNEQPNETDAAPSIMAFLGRGSPTSPPTPAPVADTPNRDDEASERRRRADLLAMLLGVSVDDTATGPAPSAPDPSTSEPSTFESAPPSPD